jgi:hypothetical protein
LGSVKKMRRAFWIACTLLTCVPLSAFADDLAIPGKIYDAKQAEEFSKARFAEGLAGAAPFWTPSEAEVRVLERSLPEFLAAHWPKDRGPKIDASRHKRQYFGVTRNGHKLVFVNAFCEEHTQQDPDWSKHFVFVFDGGSCFFQLYYDPSANSFLDLRVNGFASRTLPNKALQLTANSAFQLRFGSLLAFNLGGSATFGGAVVRS